MKFNFESTTSKKHFEKKEKEIKFAFPYVTLLKLDFEEKEGVKSVKTKQRRQIELSDSVFALLGNPTKITLAEDDGIIILNADSFTEEFIKENKVTVLPLTKDKRITHEKKYSYILNKYNLSQFEDNYFKAFEMEGELKAVLIAPYVNPENEELSELLKEENN